MNEGIGLENIDITNEELQRFSRAFKNEEFKKLFADYCEEISDPSNKRLYESELTQLEAERGIELTFINPEPGYVIKTIVNGKDKVFINVAQCDKVARPTSTCGRDASGHKGLQWSLPYTQSPLRKDVDKKGELCAVYDVVFHPDTLHLAAKNTKFRQLVTDTACDAVQKAFGVQLDLVNRKFPKIAFKGIARATVIRKKSDHPPSDIEPSPIDKIYPPLKDDQQTSSYASAADWPSASDSIEQYNVPSHKIVHRRNVEYHEMTTELDAKLNVTVPRDLVVTIELPLLRSADDVTLDVTQRKLFLISEVPAKYKLNVDLPYAVDELMGTAKFDKTKRRLIVTLPVVHKQLGLVNLCHTDSGVEVDVDRSSNSADSERDKNGSQSPNVQPETAVSIDFLPEIKELSKKPPANNSTCTVTTTSTNSSSDDVFLIEPFTTAFLDAALAYELPSFACNTLENTVAFTLHVKNVDPSSMVVEHKPLSVHIRFTSIGVGFYPQHFAFCVRFPASCGRIIDCQPEAWDNNVILQIELSNGAALSYCETGLDLESLTVYRCGVTVDDDQPSKSAPNDTMIVQVDAVDKNEMRIAITNPVQNIGTAEQAKAKKKNKNKKQRSYSESHCDDLKAESEAAHQVVQHQTDTKVSLATTSGSIDIKQKSPTKERSFSESSNDEQVVPQAKCIKSILKRRSSFNRSISESSVDDHFYSCSIDLGVGSIPEEGGGAPMSESCKKTVRFDNNIRKQLYKIRSTILGQRKPQSDKHKKKKKRTTERRYSEGEASEYDAKSPPNTAQTSRIDQATEKRDSGVDLSDDPCSNTTNTPNLRQKKDTAGHPKTAHDLEFKNDMIFEIEM